MNRMPEAVPEQIQMPAVMPDFFKLRRVDNKAVIDALNLIKKCGMNDLKATHQLLSLFEAVPGLTGDEFHILSKNPTPKTLWDQVAETASNPGKLTGDQKGALAVLKYFALESLAEGPRESVVRKGVIHVLPESLCKSARVELQHYGNYLAKTLDPEDHASARFFNAVDVAGKITGKVAEAGGTAYLVLNLMGCSFGGGVIPSPEVTMPPLTPSTEVPTAAVHEMLTAVSAAKALEKWNTFTVGAHTFESVGTPAFAKEKTDTSVLITLGAVNTTGAVSPDIQYGFGVQSVKDASGKTFSLPFELEMRGQEVTAKALFLDKLLTTAEREVFNVGVVDAQGKLTMDGTKVVIVRGPAGDRITHVDVQGRETELGLVTRAGQPLNPSPTDIPSDTFTIVFRTGGVFLQTPTPDLATATPDIRALPPEFVAAHPDATVEMFAGTIRVAYENGAPIAWYSENQAKWLYPEPGMKMSLEENFPGLGPVIYTEVLKSEDITQQVLAEWAAGKNLPRDFYVDSEKDFNASEGLITMSRLNNVVITSYVVEQVILNSGKLEETSVYQTRFIFVYRQGNISHTLQMKAKVRYNDGNGLWVINPAEMTGKYKVGQQTRLNFLYYPPQSEVSNQKLRNYAETKIDKWQTLFMIGKLGDTKLTSNDIRHRLLRNENVFFDPNEVMLASVYK